MAKKKVVKKEVKNSEPKKKETKNIISIILGSISIIISILVPYFVAITGTLGIIFAYVEKGKGSKKLNTWAFVLNLIGLFLAIVFLTLSLLTIIYLGMAQQGVY